MVKIWTGKTLRDTVGVGSVVDTHHEGETKRPTELKALDMFGATTNKTPDDFYRERAKREAAERAKRASEAEKS